MSFSVYDIYIFLPYTLVRSICVYAHKTCMCVYGYTHGCIAFEFRDLLDAFKNYNSIFSATDSALADHAVLFKNQFAMDFF